MTKAWKDFLHRRSKDFWRIGWCEGAIIPIRRGMRRKFWLLILVSCLLLGINGNFKLTKIPFNFFRSHLHSNLQLVRQLASKAEKHVRAEETVGFTHQKLQLLSAWQCRAVQHLQQWLNMGGSIARLRLTRLELVRRVRSSGFRIAKECQHRQWAKVPGDFDARTIAEWQLHSLVKLAILPDCQLSRSVAMLSDLIDDKWYGSGDFSHQRSEPSSSSSAEAARQLDKVQKSHNGEILARSRRGFVQQWQ